VVQRTHLSNRKLDVRIFVKLKKHVAAKVEDAEAIEAAKATNNLV
jgi:hypothetical protein